MSATFMQILLLVRMEVTKITLNISKTIKEYEDVDEDAAEEEDEDDDDDENKDENEKEECIAW